MNGTNYVDEVDDLLPAKHLEVFLSSLSTARLCEILGGQLEEDVRECEPPLRTLLITLIKRKLPTVGEIFRRVKNEDLDHGIKSIFDPNFLHTVVGTVLTNILSENQKKNLVLRVSSFEYYDMRHGTTQRLVAESGPEGL